MKIRSSNGEIVEVPAEYQEVVRQNINNPEYITVLAESFKGNNKQYGGLNDHLSVYPMGMQEGGQSNPNFPQGSSKFTSDRLNKFLGMVKESAQKAVVKQLYKDATNPEFTPMEEEIMRQGGSTPYQNGLTAGTGWLARHGGSHGLPMAQYGFPYENRVGLGKSTYLPPLNIDPISYSTDQQIVPGTQITGVSGKPGGRKFTLDVNVPQDQLRITNQMELNPMPGQQDWSTPSFGGPYDVSGNQIELPDYSSQTPPTMDPNQNQRLAVTPPTSGVYKGDKIKFKKNPRLSGEQKVMLANTMMEGITAFANRIDENRKEAQLMKRMTADRLFDPIQGNRGDYTTNYGYLRPDQMTPVQYPGAAGSYSQYGGSQDAGVYMTEDEIQQILANGGEIEYLD